MNITILYNAPFKQLTQENRASEEDTVKAATIAQQALQSRNHTVTLHPITPQSVASIGSIRADCILNFVEYTGMELPYIAQVFLELRKLGLPFTGSTFENYYTTANKITMKQAFDVYGIRSPNWQLFETGDEAFKLSFPLLVKLAYEHSGVGLTEKSIVHSKKDALKQITHLITSYKQPVLAEEYIEGRELQVTLIDDNQTTRMLPIAEYLFPIDQKLRILTYESRWHNEDQSHVRYEVGIAKLSPKAVKNIETLCITAYKQLDFTNYARFDLRLTDDIPYIIETNANPGLDDDPENGLVTSYLESGMTYPVFLEHILEDAIAAKRRK